MSLKDLFFQNLDEVSATLRPGMNLGDVRWEGNKCYKFVQYHGGTAALDLVPGDVLVYRNVVENQVTADVSDITATEVGAGVAVAAVDISEQGASNLCYMWIQTKGPATLAVAIGGSSPVNGDALHVVGAADKAVNCVSDTTTAHPNHQIGVAINVSEKLILCDFPF